MRKARGFTLIELLVVVAIIALLLSIVLPSLSAVRRSSKSAKCKANLYAIGVGMQAYFSTHNDIFPCVAGLPSDEVNVAQSQGDREPYQPLPVVLEKEMQGESEVYLCPQDLVTSEDPALRAIGILPGKRYYDTEGLSYEYNTLLNPDYDTLSNRFGPQKRRRVRGTRLLRQIFNARMADLQMLYDFEPFHGGADRQGSINYLYADLHVDSK